MRILTFKLNVNLQIRPIHQKARASLRELRLRMEQRNYILYE